MEIFPFLVWSCKWGTTDELWSQNGFQEKMHSHSDTSLASHTILVMYIYVHYASMSLLVSHTQLVSCVCGWEFYFHFVYLPSLFENPLVQQITSLCIATFWISAAKHQPILEVGVALTSNYLDMSSVWKSLVAIAMCVAQVQLCVFSAFLSSAKCICLQRQNVSLQHKAHLLAVMNIFVFRDKRFWMHYTLYLISPIAYGCLQL